MGDLAPLARLAPPAPLTAGQMSRKQKAAVIIRLLLINGLDVPLKELPEDLQAELTMLLGNMRHIDRDTLSGIVEEFIGELEELGLTFPRGVAGALSALDGKISAHTAARLRKEAGVRQTGDPWDRVRALDLKKLRPIAETESIEIAAVMLSKLDTGKAAELLSQLPGPRARRITYAISLTSGISPEALDRIGLSLASQLDAQPDSVFDKDPVERVGAILNFSTASTRDDVLEGLDETDSEFAEKVRKAIFTYTNIPARVAPRDIPKVVRQLDPMMLVTALAASTAGEEAATAEYILGNMSARLADSLREEVADRDKVKAKDAEEAMNAVVAEIRNLEAAGELLLLAGDDQEED
ncbi:flagellar motor switch protein FliG [Pseudooceanicola antarcticus]|uniref:Flagellar motor switch protein FliG n=1 Tax=Pseudooceanicola antarcticus TaxID=1247613 RepID=A0A285J7J5_9RHOB|nr:FliG C-terminal domain-containing protein [Pseudooceanicola antarcticus]PJE27043.1 flagellar motor switch protein FliG [Pseudooceanicola antarcticus]SNY56254.1 flagellar motor switch protein FliG [Pseudooceanicola antarcticus]